MHIILNGTKLQLSFVQGKRDVVFESQPIPTAHGLKYSREVARILLFLRCEHFRLIEKFNSTGFLDWNSPPNEEHLLRDYQKLSSINLYESVDFELFIEQQLKAKGKGYFIPTDSENLPLETLTLEVTYHEIFFSE